MPDFFPEDQVILPGDDSLRTTAKWCQSVYDSVGNVPTIFPEGTAPKPGDSMERLTKKINAMLEA